MDDIKKKLHEEIAALDHELRHELPAEIKKARTEISAKTPSTTRLRSVRDT
jgi:hypothetical protein